MAWEPTQAEKSVKPDGTSYRITHDDGRYGTIRFRNDRAIVISVGPRLYTLDGWWNNEPGNTSLTLIRSQSTSHHMHEPLARGRIEAPAAGRVAKEVGQWQASARHGRNARAKPGATTTTAPPTSWSTAKPGATT